MTVVASCTLQGLLDEAVDKHGCGLLCTVLEGLMRAHSVRMESAPHGLLVKAFFPLRCSSSSTSTRSGSPRSDAPTIDSTSSITRAEILRVRPRLPPGLPDEQVKLVCRNIPQEDSLDIPDTIQGGEAAQHFHIFDDGDICEKSTQTEDDLGALEAKMEFLEEKLQRLSVDQEFYADMHKFRLEDLQVDDHLRVLEKVKSVDWRLTLMPGEIYRFLEFADEGTNMKLEHIDEGKSTGVILEVKKRDLDAFESET